MTANYKALGPNHVDVANRQRSALLRTVLVLVIVVFVLFCLLGYFYRPEAEDSTRNQDHLQPEASHEALLSRLKTILSCHTGQTQVPWIESHGGYYLLRNFVQAEEHVECYETVTYTTHGDYTFLDNLIPLLERWQAPVSVALYAPGDDLDRTVDLIRSLLECHERRLLVHRFVSFHLYFDFENLPPHPVSHYRELMQVPYECQNATLPIGESFRRAHNLTYPVNVGRNVARSLATTHFVLASDIELYPSPDFIPMFLRMIAHPFYQYTLHGTPSVYVLPVFEIAAGSAVLDGMPENKAQLVEALGRGDAVKLHQEICSNCHTVPDYEKWLGVLKDDYTMDILTTAKREYEFGYWEPIYVGTNRDPEYDERLSWEGKADKMTQGYIMCVMGYDFHVLDNGFLVHRPGIKTPEQANRPLLQAKQRSFIRETIHGEVTALYGLRVPCKI
ncbi:beta-1,4-glucuronyltransferase 1-like [Anopheles bellator]|uniref:beta-1,4-glucuronyltransferase 1-like n=1 Tax=Anopheles bellator TaxID=139047 RepID=UPI002649B8B0|nr:beta-1,4-glucuronyltransferase 1-like [Anopheles bellator]